MLDQNPFKCAEVIAVLLEMLENRKEDLIVILAEYEAQMEAFMQNNQGLESRFPITIHFEDFTEDELCKIFMQDCEKGGMSVSEEGLTKFREVIREEMKKDSFGNGRAVRNIYELSFRRHAVRYYESGEDLDPEIITAEDIVGMTELNEGALKSIGFRV